MAKEPKTLQPTAAWPLWVLGALVLAGAVWVVAQVVASDPEKYSLKPTAEEVARDTASVLTSLGPILTSDDPKALAERAVALRGVSLRPAPNGRLVWILDLGGAGRLPAVPLGEVPPDDLDGVTVEGRLKKVGDDEIDDWGLSEAEAEAVRAIGLYVVDADWRLTLPGQ